MLALGSQDLWWAAGAAFVAAWAGWFAIKTRLGMSWLIRRMRRGYLEWFSAAVDYHVAPKLDALHDEIAVDVQAGDRMRETVEAHVESDARAFERTDETLDRIEAQLATSNGLSIGKLADNQEGRRILSDIGVAERTDSEQGYVERLEESEEHP